VFTDRVSTGELRGGDPRQLDALGPLQRLFDEVVEEAAKPPSAASAAEPANSGGWFFSAPAASETKQGDPSSAKGVYTHGGVGCGKTMLMDMFAECVGDVAPALSVKQVHFAAFMLDIHKRCHELKHLGDPLPTIAEEMLAAGKKTGSIAGILCFDEFQVADIADAMVIRRIFETLFSSGMVVVATSNRPPRDLYLHGLQRESFLPFIDEVYEHLEVHNVDAGIDYRLGFTEAIQATYFDKSQGEREAFHGSEQLWRKLTKGGDGVKPTTLVVPAQGRSVDIPEACIGAKVARFSFSHLCDNPLGSADFLAIAAAFNTVFITDVPQLDANTLPQARRLILLVDALYARRVLTIFTAANSPTQLFDKSGVGGVKDEGFAFDRTVSRILEMQSEEYTQAQHIGADALGSAAAAEEGEKKEEEEEGDLFLLRFESQSLSGEDISAIWDQFDADRNGLLDRQELRLMLESLSLVRNGHRTVPPELLQDTWRKLHADGSAEGDVSFVEFETYMRQYGLYVDYVI
jgi:predicted ATPase